MAGCLVLSFVFHCCPTASRVMERVHMQFPAWSCLCRVPEAIDVELEGAWSMSPGPMSIVACPIEPWAGCSPGWIEDSISCLPLQGSGRGSPPCAVWVCA